GGGAAAGGGRAPSLPQAARLRRAVFPVRALSRATRSRCLGPGATPLPPRPGEGGREATGWGGLGDTERRVDAGGSALDLPCRPHPVSPFRLNHPPRDGEGEGLCPLLRKNFTT